MILSSILNLLKTLVKPLSYLLGFFLVKDQGKKEERAEQVAEALKEEKRANEIEEIIKRMSKRDVLNKLRDKYSRSDD